MLQWLGQLPEDEDFADRRPARRLTSTYFSMLPSARAAFSVPPRGTSAVGVRERAERAPAPWFGSRCAPRPQNGGARAWTNQGRLVVRKDAQFVGTSRRLQHPRARAAWQQQCPMRARVEIGDAVAYFAMNARFFGGQQQASFWGLIDDF